MDSDTDYGASDDGQVHRRVGVADTASVLTGDDIQPKMQAGFDSPMLAVSVEHLLGVHLGNGPGSNQVFDFNFFSRFAPAIDATGQPGGLLCEGKAEA